MILIGYLHVSDITNSMFSNQVDGFYNGGIFKVILKFNSDYPFKPPKVLRLSQSTPVLKI